MTNPPWLATVVFLVSPGSLDDVIRQHRVIVCVGAGGVGKTTTAAAIAVHAAQQGRRVLCMTIDPARRLAMSLGLSEMRNEEQPIPASMFHAAGLPLPGKGSLSAMMLDGKKTFDDLVAKFAPTPALRSRILTSQMYRYVSSSLAGTQEYMAMEKLHAVQSDDRFDLIVLDTPPTANAIDFLEAPERLVGVLDSPAMRWLTRALSDTDRFSFGLVGRGASFVLRSLAEFTGAEFLEQAGVFVRDMDALFGGFRERAQRVASFLRDRSVAFVLVAAPNTLAIEECVFFADHLALKGMKRAGYVINQVHPPLTAVVDDVATRRALSARVTNVDDLTARMHSALADERTRAALDRAQIDGMAGALAGVLKIEVPAFDRDVHDLASLGTLAKYLFAHDRQAST